MDRCNLTITRLPNYEDLPEFLAGHNVEVVASLPSFAPRQTDAQRGEGVFDDSIAALRRFNELGYGAEGSGLLLNLVTNPGRRLPAGVADRRSKPTGSASCIGSTASSSIASTRSQTCRSAATCST